MRRQFEDWMKSHERKKPNTAYQYAISITKISKHYSRMTNSDVEIYNLDNPRQIEPIVNDYSQGGRFSAFGREGNGTIRNAIATYLRFVNDKNMGREPEPTEESAIYDALMVRPAEDEDYLELESSNFTYERDLQSSLISQISVLFEGYKIYGAGLEGVEFPIEGKRIDVLLEETGGKSLIAVELKSGVADFRVFGQVSMYIGLLSKRSRIEKSLQ